MSSLLPFNQYYWSSHNLLLRHTYSLVYNTFVTLINSANSNFQTKKLCAANSPTIGQLSRVIVLSAGLQAVLMVIPSPVSNSSSAIFFSCGVNSTNYLFLRILSYFPGPSILSHLQPGPSSPCLLDAEGNSYFKRYFKLKEMLRIGCKVCFVDN